MLSIIDECILLGVTLTTSDPKAYDSMCHTNDCVCCCEAMEVGGEDKQTAVIMTDRVNM